jgi:hypothetical protein
MTLSCVPVSRAADRRQYADRHLIAAENVLIYLSSFLPLFPFYGQVVVKSQTVTGLPAQFGITSTSIKVEEPI